MGESVASRPKPLEIGLYMLYMDAKQASHGRSRKFKSCIAHYSTFIISIYIALFHGGLFLLTNFGKMGHNCAVRTPFLSKKRGKYWHFRLANEKTFHTTGKTTKPRAIEFVHERTGRASISPLTFRQDIEPYFVLDQCPHVRRLLNEGKSVTRRYVENRRMLIEKHILPDPIADRLIADIRQADLS
jgi:hypothetical protein